MTQMPTVGRIVHYVSYGTPGGEYLRECRAAIVTEVGAGEDLPVGLAVLNPSGLFFNQDVRYADPYSPDAPQSGTWHWPERDDG